MPIPLPPLRLGDRGDAVSRLHRSLEAIGRVIDQKERDTRAFGRATEAVLRKLQEQSLTPVTGEFDIATHRLVTNILSDIGPFTVYGAVTGPDGRPVAGLAVVAQDVDLRHREDLGKTTTDSGGDYEVRYSAQRFTRAEKGSADVQVRVPGAESPIAFNAPAELRIDLTTAQRPGLSEFELLEAAAIPLLAGSPPTELTPADVDFLTGETGLAADGWRAYIDAYHLAAEAGADIPVAAFYGWRRTDQPGTWDALRTVPLETLRTSLVEALDRNLVPAALRADLDAILARIPNEDRAALTGLLGAVNVPPEAVTKLVGRVERIDGIGDDVLAELVDAGDLSDVDAARVGLAASAHRLVDGDPATVAAVIGAEFPAIPGGRLRGARDLAVLEVDDWAGVLQTAGSPASARSCAIAATAAFPEDALRYRASRVPEGLAGHLDRFRTLPADALDHDFDDLDVPDGEREALRAAHTEVRTLVRTHLGLGLAEVVRNGAEDAHQVISTRIRWVAEVLERNPDTPFAELDYLPDNPELTMIDFGDLELASRMLVLADLRAQRRMTAVAGNAVVARELMVAGITSASVIARSSVAELAAQTGLATAEIQAIQAAAMPIASKAALSWFSIYGATLDWKTTPVRVLPTREQFFHSLSGYADLLTDQQWCDCDDCQSVFSPAAYFVDLMHYVEKQILASSFAAQPGHPLHLERRRPDLWKLPLSCANTKDPVPTLDIVNELLERFIREVGPLPSTTPIWVHLAEQEASFRQPFTLSIERLDTLLGHFALSRYDVAKAMRASREVRTRARLGLSSRAYTLVTVARTGAPYLSKLFGISTTATAPDQVLPTVEMLPLIRSTGLDHDVLAAALVSDFVRADGTATGPVTITVGKRFPDDVQNNTEVVGNLSLRRLDRLHRFVRLWRTVPWTVAELDHVLGRFGTSITGSVLDRVVDLLDLADVWSMPLEQVVTVTDAFPVKVLRGSDTLFDRLFNPPALADRDGRWTTQTTGRFTHPAWRTTGTGDGTLARLLAGLQLSDQEFLDLVGGIRTDPGLDYQPAAPGTNASISLARASIAALYRHARVRAALRLPVPDFVALLRVAGLPYLRNADDVRALRDVAAWRRSTATAVAELVHLTGGTSDQADLTPDLPAVVVAVADAATRAAILSGTDPLSLLDLAVAPLLGRSPQEIGLLRECLATPTTAEQAAIVRVLDGGTAPADLAVLTMLLAGVARFHRLLPRPAFDDDGLTFLRRERAAFFGPVPAADAGETVTFDVIRRVAAYRRLVTRGDDGFNTAGPEPDVTAVRAVVAAGAAATNVLIAQALGTDEARVTALRPHLTAFGRPFDDFAVIEENLALANRLGLGGEALGRMLDDNQLSRAADDVLGAFRAKYADPKVLADKLTPYEDILRGRLRDGLVDYLTTRWPQPFSGPDRLYDYFLVDVQVEGCARTSRVVSATSSVQLYVHRVLMNLERSEDWDPSTTPPTGVFARFASAARRAEWQWRKQYRVWEANRKVFLYPENYLEPELRDDKTPLFAEFEDTLLAQDLSPQHLNDAYSGYLTGFDGLAQMQIAGAYRDNGAQTLHLFGVTQDDAPVFYYRSVDESAVSAAHPAPLYSAWHRIDLPIPVRKVSPSLHEGRLYLFWVENATRPISAFIDGNSKFAGYRHTVRVRYSTLRLDGTWAAPQLLRFADQNGMADARIVEDPLDLSVVHRLQDQINQLNVDRPALTDEVTTKTTIRNQVRDLLIPPLAEARRDAEDKLYAGLTVGQALELAWLVAHGTPPTAAWWTVKAVAKAVYQATLNRENSARELLRNCEDQLANAQTRLRNLDTRIAELEAAKNSEVKHVRWDRSLRDHKESLDSYHPDGWQWDRVYPDLHVPGRPDLPPWAPQPSQIRLTLVPNGNRLPDNVPYLPGDLDAVSGILRAPLVAETPYWQFGKLLTVTDGRIHKDLTASRGVRGQSAVLAASILQGSLTGGTDIGAAPAAADVQVVMGWPNSIVVQHAGDSVWLRPVGSDHQGLRLGTTLTRSLARRFWDGGPTGLLAADFQRALVETRSRISPVAGQSDPSRQSPFHPEHAWLGYYRETFLHIPFLIADHLNTDQDFAGAQRWYHTIFDPTAADGNAWRNRELAEPDNQSTTLRDLLVDSAALAAYRADPFSPHAIARTRMGAYAKSVVMKYIDNLLDWGDSLFTQFTTESVNEATMLYVMARDILGPRPETLGPCGTDAKPRTYRQIRAGLGEVSDFLVELETPGPLSPVATSSKGNRYVVPTALAPATVAPAARMFAAPVPPQAGSWPLGFDEPGPAQTPVTHDKLNATPTVWTSTAGTPLTTLGGAPAGGGVTVTGTGVTIIPGGGFTDFEQGFGPGTVGTRFSNPFKPYAKMLDVKYTVNDVTLTVDRDRHEPDLILFSPIELVPPKESVFCIPSNRELLGYWDRVDDRLRKIRNCMDISGARRRPELFSPELDPRLLVRMTAAGLTIDDVLGVAAGQQPAYRFDYLAGKARELVATVQSFGSQLQGALERSDAQELEHLRAVHEQNLLTMRRKLAQLEIDAAEDSLDALRLQREAVEARRQHFVALREAGTLPQEHKQQDLQREAAQFRAAASIAQTVASILTIIPDFGAWTAMKFGGSQLGAAGRAVGDGLGAYAGYLDSGGMMAGVEASVRRRDEEWQHQEDSARRELAQLDRGITAAEIRRDIAVRSLEVHERTIEQAEEVFAFFRERFSSVDRYRLLVKELRKLHKVAFDSALRMAQLAEQAYRAERRDDGLTDDDMLTGGYWNAPNAGLLAGDKLLTDLQRLERQYVARNARKLEISQSFSLAQITPDRLAELRRTGECVFSIPEWFFDLSYPGQYRRRLKAVRLTMPCVTGPYTNVGATLRLTGSRIRATAPAGENDALVAPVPVPLGQTVAIATSRAQRDSGVFEFNFRDERYLPFEGAGAISDWSLSLPKALRVFDYSTISDVVVHLDYTADHNTELERRWDKAAGIVTLLQGDMDGTPPLVRRFSLRDELPDVFHQLLTRPAGATVEFTLDARHFSLFLAGQELEARSASLSILTPLVDLDGAAVALAVKPVPPKVAAYVTVTAAANPHASMPGGLREFDCGSVLPTPPATAGLAAGIVGTYLVKIAVLGALGTAGTVSSEALRDVVLQIGYRLATQAT